MKGLRVVVINIPYPEILQSSRFYRDSFRMTFKAKPAVYYLTGAFR